MDLFEGNESGEGGRGSSKRQRTSNTNADVNLLPNGVGVINVSVEDTSAAGGAGGATGGGPNGKRRARSDSAPLGYGLGAGLNTGWQGGTRPRSGSGLTGRGMGAGMPGVVAANRTNGGGNGNGNCGGPALLSMPTLTSNSPGR